MVHFIRLRVLEWMTVAGEVSMEQVVAQLIGAHLVEGGNGEGADCLFTAF